uniref:Tc1-like transposase DDE domain-containing protein n=1 Tax=Phlebotomus papatasi TaxID=29031 RepID=A0A1B0DQ35_PHLPP
MKTDCGVITSVRTVQRALRECGLRAVRRQKKPKFSPSHQRRRLDFAIRHKYWTVDDWKRLIWSDETMINRLGSDGSRFVWKNPTSPVVDHHIIPTLKFGGGSLMMWGCMTYNGVGFACQIVGRMNAEAYVNILDNNFIPTLDSFMLDCSDIIFQQDNNPKCTSRLAKSWFDENSIEVLEWPAQSPDLNPIEHLWSYLKRKLLSYETTPESIHELWKRIRDEWYRIPLIVCKKLVEMGQKRVKRSIHGSKNGVLNGILLSYRTGKT